MHFSKYLCVTFDLYLLTVQFSNSYKKYSFSNDEKALGVYLATLYQDRRGELVELGLDGVVLKRRHPRAGISTPISNESEFVL